MLQRYLRCGMEMVETHLSCGWCLSGEVERVESRLAELENLNENLTRSLEAAINREHQGPRAMEGKS